MNFIFFVEHPTFVTFNHRFAAISPLSSLPSSLRHLRFASLIWGRADVAETPRRCGDTISFPSSPSAPVAVKAEILRHLSSVVSNVAIKAEMLQRHRFDQKAVEMLSRLICFGDAVEAEMLWRHRGDREDAVEMRGEKLLCIKVGDDEMTLGFVG